MVDARGKEYGVGDTIVYPVRYGSYVTMREAKVERIVCSCGKSGTFSNSACPGGRITKMLVKRGGRKLTLTNYANIVKVAR